MSETELEIKRQENDMLTIEQLAQWLANNINVIALRRAVQIVNLREKTDKLKEELGYEDE